MNRLTVKIECIQFQRKINFMIYENLVSRIKMEEIFTFDRMKTSVYENTVQFKHQVNKLLLPSIQANIIVLFQNN